MSVAVHEVFELTFEAERRVIDDPTPLSATFTHVSAGTRTVLGFWDGDATYRVRFAPPAAGEWSWVTRSAEASLADHDGVLTAVDTGARGPVSVASGYHFVHADGTPFRPVGATAYNWLHQEEPLYTDTVDAIADAGFTKFRFMVFPQAGGYVEHFPTLLPFERDGGVGDPARPDVGFFRRLDAAVADLGRRGIQADVLIFNAYDNGFFGLDALTEAQDAIYLRYLVARLGAFAHVWWSLCNEFDILKRPLDRWERMGELLAEIDAHAHLRSIHNWVQFYDHNRPWITHASIQNGFATEEFGRASLYRDTYRKPIVLDEIKYEGDIPERWGHLDAAELVHRFWITTVSGCYASHGESFVTASGSLHMVEGGRLRGEAPARLGFLRRVLDDPASVVGVARRQYVQYLGRSAPAEWTFRLPQGHVGDRLEIGDVFDVDVVDAWDMTRTRVPEPFTLTAVERNDAYDRTSAPLPLPAGRMLVLVITRRV